MSSSKREEERNEKIIRGLMKLPPNRRCINCNSVGPQYVCTNFWTFVCLSCSGIHREFTHRVKSVSMSKFTPQEVNSLQQGGNQRFREVYLKNWDMTRMRLPDSSNPERIRDFIRSVYINKKYFGERSSEKPTTDSESPMAGSNDVRRPSSYHSFSQSPPYDYQYEERRYGKGALAPAPRRLGSARAAGFQEDRFANERESTGSRLSDFSVSSSGDAFRHPQRTSSSGSFGSFDSTSLPDTTLQEQQLTRGPHQSALTSSSSLPPLSKPTSPSSFNQPIDLFAGFNDQNSVNRPGPAFNAQNEVQVNKLGSPFNVPSQVQVNKPGSPFNVPSQVQQAKPVPAHVNKPGLAFNAQNQVQVNKPITSVNLPNQVQTNVPGPAFNAQNQVQVNKPGTAFNAPNQVQVNKPDPASTDFFSGFNTEPSNEGWANFDTPEKNKQVNVIQSSPVIASTGDDLNRPFIAPVKSTAVPAVQSVPDNISQETSQVWDAYAFGETSGNMNQDFVSKNAEIVSVPNSQISPLNEVQMQIPVQSTVAHVPVPQTVSHPMVPTNQEKSEIWNAFGESNKVVAPVPVSVESSKVTGTTGTQIPVQSTMPTERAPLPDTLFSNHGFSQNWNNAPVNHIYGNNNVYGNVNNTHSIAYDQYLKVEASNIDGVYSNMNINNPSNISGPLQGMPYQTTKSTNPFDFPDESDTQPNNNMYMDMRSLQVTLPAQQPSFDFYSQFYSQNASSTYTPSVPQGGMQYLSGQAPNPQLPSQSKYPSVGGNPFA